MKEPSDARDRILERDLLRDEITDLRDEITDLCDENSDLRDAGVRESRMRA
jgi:hypothetical protein